MRSLGVVCLVGCGRLGFEPSGVDGNTADQPSGGAITTPFLRCDGIDDAVTFALGQATPIRTIEMRARIAPPANALDVGQDVLVVHDNHGTSMVGLRIATSLAHANPDPIPHLQTMIRLDPVLVPAQISSSDRTDTVWRHYASTYEPGGVALYTDGVADVVAENAFQLVPSLSALDLCGSMRGHDIGTRRFAAIEIDWLRISSTVRYSGPFTPSIEAPAGDAATVLGIDFDDGTLSGAGRAGVPIGQPTIVTP